MSFVQKLKCLLPFWRRAVERDIREELEALAQIAEPDGARRQLGNLTSVAEEAREAWTWTWLEQLRGDVRYAGRTMRRAPIFTAAAVLSLALGIGSNTAIFSLINAILLKALPVSHPENLVVLASFSRTGRVGDFGYQDYQVVREGTRALSGVLAASNLTRTDVGWGAATEAAHGKIVSANYFSVLGVRPVLGRVFNDGDEESPVAVVSHRFWERHLGGSPAVVGQQIDLDGAPFTIAGIAPPGFMGETVGEAPDIWATVSLMPAARRSLPGFTWLNLMGRLKPGVQAAQAGADLDSLVPEMPNSVAHGGFVQRIAVESGNRGGSGLRDTFTVPLRILMAVVAVVLLVACANLASLLLARAATRRREIATRLALGAGAGRIVRQLLTENLLLALMGGALGLLFAIWSERFLLTLVAGVGRSITVDLRPDIRILAFNGLVSIATGLLFGLAPALQAVRQRAGADLKLNSRTSQVQGRRRGLNDWLIAMQIALSMLLLVMGALFIRTIQNLKSLDVGFQAAHLLTLQIDVPRGYQPTWANVIEPLMHRMEAIPGIQAASVSFVEILADDGSGVSGLKFEGSEATKENQRARANWVGPRYFETSGIPLLEGREFTFADNLKAKRVAIINQSVARHYFANGRAVGRRFEFNREPYEIVGVAKDAKYNELREPATPLVYFAIMQTNTAIHSLEVRTTGSTLLVAGAVRGAVREIDPRLRIGEITTLGKRIDQKLSREFLVADLAGFFSGLTLLLVCIGVYGTLAYSVARRTNEIGIRMALGARTLPVVKMILGEMLWMLVPGLTAGIAAAMAAGHVVISILFGVKPTDVPTILVTALILTAATLAAGFIPARRASRVDPATALRFE